MHHHTNARAIAYCRSLGIPFAGARSARLGGLVYRLSSRQPIRRIRSPRAAAAIERRMPILARAFLSASKRITPAPPNPK